MGSSVGAKVCTCCRSRAIAGLSPISSRSLLPGLAAAAETRSGHDQASADRQQALADAHAIDEGAIARGVIADAHPSPCGSKLTCRREAWLSAITQSLSSPRPIEIGVASERSPPARCTE